MTPNESVSVHQFPAASPGTIPTTRYLQHGSAHRTSLLFRCSCADCNCPALTRDGGVCFGCQAGAHTVPHTHATTVVRVLVAAVVCLCAAVFGVVVYVHLGGAL